MRELQKVFKALADESRLRVLSLLMERESCVCEIMQATGYSQSKASRILTALHGAGFLSLRKEGLWSLYAIDREGMPPYLATILEAVDRAVRENPRLAADREKLRNAARIGPGCVTGACRTGKTARAA
jgi:ArsR family transcriptional regulator